ncbi:MAG: hypothetical protein ACYCZA_12885 [Thiobacillus sp.]
MPCPPADLAGMCMPGVTLDVDAVEVVGQDECVHSIPHPPSTTTLR